MESVHTYNVKVIKTDEGYTGKCVEIPGAISEGETLEELRKNMAEAIQLILEEIKESYKDKQNLVVEIRNNEPSQS